LSISNNRSVLYKTSTTTGPKVFFFWNPQLQLNHSTIPSMGFYCLNGMGIPGGRFWCGQKLTSALYWESERSVVKERLDLLCCQLHGNRPTFQHLNFSAVKLFKPKLFVKWYSRDNGF
jgi:hypothetical protein